MDNKNNSNFATISEDSIKKITSLENELSSENKEDVVLIAYSNKTSG